ncbi:ATP-dependent dethiobiotin synthetase BioD 1 [Marinomonas aquimarina]|uniref:ATP-dependent dethiobiotin synthetase BioD n=1 Tax=Marinomonas aquimarina TaxID=295068 RepID=A0A1A8T236_9GAMM|nr:dethiobiotin synthase [Marinomonas aquimarina]SBS24979.1 ATP-dependent dethiobiotin synthetase BioD 1 [Marinomonas aquimarina]
MAKQQYFITGTDTDAGKTHVCVGLLKAAARRGSRSMGVKPIAAGAEVIDGKLCNEDALQIQAASSVALRYEQVNPVVFAPAIAPHIAAAKENKIVTVSRLEGFVRGTLLSPHDFALVEGAGGWRVPVNDRELLSDLAKRLGMPVIVVVDMRLGCLNHAFLTMEAIRRDGLQIAGWVANGGQHEMPCYEENLATLNDMLSAPLLGSLSWHQDSQTAEQEFDQLLQNLSS